MKLQRWIEDLEDNEWGYVRTKTPLMAKSDLYKISGHWDHYLDGMFVLRRSTEGWRERGNGTSSYDLSIPVLCIQSTTALIQRSSIQNAVRHLHFSVMKIQEKCTDSHE